MSTTTSQEMLLTRCVAGESRAWRELHARYFPVATRFLYRLGVPAADVDDLSQDVFVQVFRYLNSFEGRAEFHTWLYKICVSQASRYRRTARLAQLPKWLLAPFAQVVPGPEWSHNETIRRVQAALDAMSAKHREVFVLFELEGVDGKQVASIVGCPEATVWRRLHTARKTFQRVIAESQPDNAPAKGASAGGAVPGSRLGSEL